MKKGTDSKNNAALGCKKISNFFIKKDSAVYNANSLNSLPQEITFNDSKQKLQNLISDRNSKSICNKRKKGCVRSSVSPPFKKVSRDLMCHSSTNVQSEENDCFIVVDAERPSTSGTTSNGIKVKTPQKLLNFQSSLKEELPSLLRDKISTQTPKKNKTKEISESSSNSSGKKSSDSKSKRTPKKLFEKSPKNIDEFNVEILRNFVKITPIKTENEKNPTQSNYPLVSNKPALKVKTKLDFSGCTTMTSSSREKENLDSLNFSDNSWDANFIDQIDYSLDLTTSQHCKIVNIKSLSTETIITIRSTNSDEQALCSLRNSWMHLKLCVGDTVRVTAKKIDEDWIINNKHGLLVFEPDLLISSTVLVNSHFCARKAILNERYRGFDPTSKFFIIGIMVHDLLQNVLKRKLIEYNAIENYAKEILEEPKWIKQIYDSGEHMSTIAEEFSQYIPQVFEFVETYVNKKNKKPVYKKGNWNKPILGIDDIEENIWCPELGLKGRIDVSLRSGNGTMPLEIKTGRASVSLEHRGQVLLYIMMMQKLNYPVTSGLLLYLKEGILKEIPSSAEEKRDLILLRNEFVHFLSRMPNVVRTEERTYLDTADIPEPIDNPYCKKCPYNTICAAYSNHKNEDISRKKHFRSVHDQVMKFLTKTHIDYFMQWSSLLSLEFSEEKCTKALKDIYTLSPEERKNKGRSLINLKISQVEEEISGICLTTFKSSLEECENFLFSGLMENSYVVVSTEKRPAVATGFVNNISLQNITVSLDRNLIKKFNQQIFHLDLYDSSVSLTYNLSSLSLILGQDEQSSRLRSIIIDKKSATFMAKLPKSLAEKGRPILKRLNQLQQRAVLKAISANDYFLIKGMPGTGKTATIVALIQLLVEMNKTVLITSHTHSAVDTVCLKLIKFGVQFMRLGSEAKMDPNLKEYSEYHLTKNCKTPEDLEAVYNSMQVLAVTCFGSGHVILSKRTLDVCIVDESTQVLQSAIIRPLHSAKTFILLGDPDQLPAVVHNKTSLELGMAESLFERLHSDEACISLCLNYRMNKPITDLANALTYNGELQIGNDLVATSSVNIPRFDYIVKNHNDHKWLIEALDTKLENAVKFIDTGPVWNLQMTVPWAVQNSSFDPQENSSHTNIYEAAVIYHLVSSLIVEGKVPSYQIGIIATYRVQVALISDLLKNFNVSVNTVDQFQGKDKPIILYSCSKSRDLSKEWVQNKFDLNEDRRRLNVAITRAKHKLIFVGDFQTLQLYSTFRSIKNNLFNVCVKLKDSEEFSWKTILNL